MAANEQISQVLLRAEPAAEGCRNLVDLALEKGGKDNVTVIIARYRLLRRNRQSELRRGLL
jgi:serine/threonine protein phosphatase PrpC